MTSPIKLSNPSLWKTSGFLNGEFSQGSAQSTFSVMSQYISVYFIFPKLVFFFGIVQFIVHCAMEHISASNRPCANVLDLTCRPRKW